MNSQCLTSDQVRAARALLGWSYDTLGRQSGTSPSVCRMFEQTGRIPVARIATRHVDRLLAIRTALARAGVEFTSGDSPGVRLRPGAPKR